jgi:hypothetical protein
LRGYRRWWRTLRARDGAGGAKSSDGRRGGQTSKTIHECNALLRAILGAGGLSVYPIRASSQVYGCVSFLGYLYRIGIA